MRMVRHDFNKLKLNTYNVNDTAAAELKYRMNTSYAVYDPTVTREEVLSDVRYLMKIINNETNFKEMLLFNKTL